MTYLDISTNLRENDLIILKVIDEDSYKKCLYKAMLKKCNVHCDPSVLMC